MHPTERVPKLVTDHFSIPAWIPTRIRQDHHVLIGAGFYVAKPSFCNHAAEAFHVLCVGELDRDLNRTTERYRRALS